MGILGRLLGGKITCSQALRGTSENPKRFLMFLGVGMLPWRPAHGHITGAGTMRVIGEA